MEKLWGLNPGPYHIQDKRSVTELDTARLELSWKPAGLFAAFESQISFFFSPPQYLASFVPSHMTTRLLLLENQGLLKITVVTAFLYFVWDTQIKNLLWS